MSTQPTQPGTDFLGMLKALKLSRSLHIPACGARAGLASDGVLVGKFTPQAVSKCFLATTAGTVFADQTTAANEATANDITLFDGSTGAVNDALYVGHSTKRFSALKAAYTTAATAVALTAVWEYWNGTAWTNLATSNQLLDSTVGSGVPWKATAGTKYVTFHPPADWAKKTVNSASAYWIRQRCTHVATSGALPTADQFWLYTLKDGLGPTLPTTGQLASIDATVLTTLSGSTADSIFLLVNLTTGATYLFTATKALAVTTDAAPAFAFSAGDTLIIQQVQGDGSTEFAGLSLALTIQPLA